MDFGIWSLLLIFIKLCLYISAFMASGSALFLLIFTHSEHAKIRAVIYNSGIIAALASVGFVLVQTGYIMEDGIAGMFDVEMLQIFLDEKIGTSLYMRLAGISLLMLLTYFSAARNVLMIVPIVMIAGSFALVGHASGDDFIYTAILLTLHLLAVSFWLGALWPLYLGAEQDYGADMLERFGKLATFIVPVLLAVGLLFGIYTVGGFSALFGSSYGLTLLVKVAIVGLLLGLATLNKISLTPQIAAKKSQAAQRLKAVIMVEAIAFAIIFLATAILTTSVELPE